MKQLIRCTLVFGLLLVILFSITLSSQAVSALVQLQGDVWNWGYGGYGQLGTGSTSSSASPLQVAEFGQTAAVAAGCYHSLALRSDGTVWTSGFNGFGQLGNGTDINSNVPVQVSGLDNITAVSGGCYHSLAVKTDGTLWGWGNNNFGELGIGRDVGSTCTGFGQGGNYCFKEPIQALSISDVSAAAAGVAFSLVLKSDGTVWAWGQYISNSDVPAQVTGLTSIVAIAAGGYHALALREDGTVWAWGQNYYGELGDGTTTSNLTPVQISDLTGVVAVSGGGWHSLALKSDGTVWSWGRNIEGQLGTGERTTTGCQCVLFPTTVISLTNVIQISAGLLHSLAVRADETVAAWGYNGDGELGIGTFSNYSAVPLQVDVITDVRTIAAGSYHNMAVIQTISNQPPIVDAGGPYTVSEGSSVIVSASGNDPENGPLNYEWDLDNNGTFETPDQSATFVADSLTAPGVYTITARVTDDGGLTATDQATVTVIFNFGGFFQPVDNLPTLNTVRAGVAVPVRFSLGGEKGLNILAPGYPKSEMIACDSTASVDGIEETATAGSSGLSYDPASGEYTYVWKTNKAWTGTCRQLVIKLIDGTYHRANFKFR